MKYLAAELALAQEARAQGTVKAKKVDETFHQPGIMTKPLQEMKFVFKRGRLLGLKATPPAKLCAIDAPAAEAGEARGKVVRPRRAPSSPAPGTFGPGARGAARPGHP